MGNRLSKIYTRTGDKGSTGLADGSRVSKASIRVEAMGTVDELDASLGVLAAANLPASIASDVRQGLVQVQHRLFDIGAELCIPGHTVVQDEWAGELEQWLDQLNADLEPLKEFILRGGSAAAAQAHLACTVCRRAERRLVELQQTETVNAPLMAYVNRLSDLLFVLARTLNHADGGGDILWRPAAPSAAKDSDENAKH